MKSTRIFTGFAGLPVCKDPHTELSRFYGRIIRELKKLPEDSKYRVATEQVFKERKDIVESTPDRDELEKKIGAGLCEEHIEQAKHELQLIFTMQKYKPWEPLEEKPPENQWKWPI